MVDEPVDHGCCNDFVTEHLAPAAERLVGSDDQGGAFVARGDELEEQVRRFGLERDVADLVDDEQRIAAKPGQLGLQGAGVVGVGEPGDPLSGGRELDPVAGLAGARIASPVARCVLPVPGGPSSSTFSFAVTKSRVPR
jgi:hypothetical protein